MTETRITVSVPESVWVDALDPMTSAMQAELGLPEPRTVRRGRGASIVYDDVTIEQAEEMAEYIGDRGESLLGQSIDDPYDPEEKRTRDTLRAAVKAAEKIRLQLATIPKAAG